MAAFFFCRRRGSIRFGKNHPSKMWDEERPSGVAAWSMTSKFFARAAHEWEKVRADKSARATRN